MKDGTLIRQLSNGEYIGISVFEVSLFPDIRIYGENEKENIANIQELFQRIGRDIYRLLLPEKFVAEIMWLNEQVENQIFISRPHIYVSFRLMGSDKLELRKQIMDFQRQVINILESNQYGCNPIVIEEDFFFNQALKKVAGENLYAIIKKEKYSVSYQSPYPYYYCDLVYEENYDNFKELLTTFSQSEESMISFQIMPARLSQQEQLYLNEVTAEINSLATGVMTRNGLMKDMAAEEAAKVLRYYNERKDGPLFHYNILVSGRKDICYPIVSKIISLLQAGKKKQIQSEFAAIDLSEERINIKQQFYYYPFNVNRILQYKYHNRNILDTVPMAQYLMRLPFIMALEEVISFFRLPLREREMSFLQDSQVPQNLELFSEDIVGEQGILMGKIQTGNQKNVAVRCPESAFTKHALIVGTPGSGKTTFSINLLLQFYKRGIPFLAVEPTKAEYRAMKDAIPDLQIFTPGNTKVSPFIWNPFIPPKGITVEQYVPSLVSAFQAAFSMPSPLDMFFLKAINESYSEYGWKSYNVAGDPGTKTFGLFEFIVIFKKLISRTNYSKEVKGNLESGGLLRLTNLLEQNKSIYDTIHTIPIEDLLSKPTVLELNSIENQEQKSLLMALLLINICIYTKVNQAGDGRLKNAILIDEAHVLLGGSEQKAADAADSKGTTVRAIQSMIAEIRAYGTSIIIADQSPTKVSREVVANTDIKIAFRLVQSLEKELIADSTNMDERNKQNLSKLRPGEAYLFYSKLDYPQLIKTDDIREKEKIRLNVHDEEIKKGVFYWKTHRFLLKPYKECSLCKACKEECDLRLKADADYFSERIFARYGQGLKEKNQVLECCLMVRMILRDLLKGYSEEEKNRIIPCTKIQLLRLLELEQGVELQGKDRIIAILKEKSNV